MPKVRVSLELEVPYGLVEAYNAQVEAELAGEGGDGDEIITELEDLVLDAVRSGGWAEIEFVV